MNFQLPVPEPNFSLENNIDLDDTLQTLQRSELMDDDENMPLIDEGPSDDEPVRHTTELLKMIIFTVYAIIHFFLGFTM